MDGLTPCYYTDTDLTSVLRTGTNNLVNDMVNWTANGYRLPTAAEWEKAARGGLAGQRFPWGNTISHANANFYNGGGGGAFPVSAWPAIPDRVVHGFAELVGGGGWGRGGWRWQRRPWRPHQRHWRYDHAVVHHPGNSETLFPCGAGVRIEDRNWN